jgi:predicted nuclease with TOPRIM domain
LIDTAWIALIGTVMGGAGLKLVESVLSRGTVKEDIATELRQELRSETKELKEHLRLLDHEVDIWKEKYFVLLGEYLELKAKVDKKQEKKGGDDW